MELLMDRLDQNAEENGKKIALSFIAGGGKVENELTYHDLVQNLNSLSNHLLNSGIEKGDRVVLVYPPSLDYMIAFLACLRAGIIAVPVFPPNPARRDTLGMFCRIVESCGAKVALTNSSYNHMKKLAGIKNTLIKRKTIQWPENLEWIVTNDHKGSSSSFKSKSSTQPTDIAFLQFTSGSTSDPKGVMITHANLAHNLTIITNELKAVDDTIVVSWLPQYHDMGLIGSFLGVLYCGGSGYYMSPLTYLQRPMIWIEAISKYKATHLQAPNFAFKLTARKQHDTQIDDIDLSSVRHIINAAEPVTEDSIEAFKDAFGKFGLGDVIFPTYGLAEHTVFVCSGGKQRLDVDKQELEVNGQVILAESDQGEGEQNQGRRRLIGCGFPHRQGVDVRIVDQETLVEVKEDTVGEIWIQSESKAAGYYMNPQVTAECFEAELTGVEGNLFLRTGDLGFLHEKELFICGRLKDLIIVGGRNYYPQDIEATAEESSDALRPGCSAAFTIDPIKEDGEEVAMVLELREVPSKSDVKETCDSIANTIKAAVNQEHSLTLSTILLLKPKTVPKTTSGKIARSWCRKGFLAETLDVVYRKSFKSNRSSLEIEPNDNNNNGTSAARSKPVTAADIATLRSMSKADIIARLIDDLSKIGNLEKSAISSTEPIATLLDSLSLSQFKGQLESRYGVTALSDGYLFRESTSLNKLAEVVRLGHAPDDGNESGSAEEGANATVQDSNSGGLAGALGCPPGVVCTIL